jgi:predicted aminopeptidase
MIRKAFAGLAFVLLLLIALNWELIGYGVQQGVGQFKIVWEARPVNEVMIDPQFPDSLKRKLKFIEEVRQYAIDSLGLKDTENYKTIYDQQGKELMWVVTACEPFSFTQKLWKFPVLGSVPYKGFFNEQRALKEREKLLAEGWDVSIRNPGGWSTLGWFTDPILSGMLERSEGDLASLIIHEMVHATIFVKDSIEFNENLASFIGDCGAEEFLRDRGGADSTLLIRYRQEGNDFAMYASHMLRGFTYLDSLYRSFTHKAEEEKKALKKSAIERIIKRADTLPLVLMQRPATRFANRLPNNAYFMNFRRYQSRQEFFRKEWRESFGSDLRRYIEHHARVHPFL